MFDKLETVMTREVCLSEASKAVLVNRQDVHGSPENSFARIAAIWSVILKVDVQAHDVPLMLAGLKIIRASDNPKHGDNWADLAGYAACGAEVAGAIVKTKANPEIQYESALKYAEHLATTIKTKHYGDKPLNLLSGDLVGILTQIDNMTAGLIREEKRGEQYVGRSPRKAVPECCARCGEWLDRCNCHPLEKPS